MSFLQRSRKIFATLALVLLLTVTTACAGAVTDRATLPNTSVGSSNAAYSHLERGDTSAGQNFGDWVVQTSRGLVKDAFVRDDNKLGVVISPQVKPQEVRTLARSLIQGFHKNFPSRDLKVLVYAPDKQLILTANYNNGSQQVEYQ